MPGFDRRAATRFRVQQGYTLIEVLVAFAVLAVALTVLLAALTNSARQVSWSERAGRAALHAQTLLAQAGVGAALAPGRSEGELDAGRYRWTMEVAPWMDPGVDAPLPVDPAAPQALALRLTVAWGEGGPRQRLQVDSLRLVQPGMERQAW